jgi:K+-transporting ATPase A subunit
MIDSYYVTNDDMIAEIERYQESKNISNELGKMFLFIASNFANKGNFSGYTWKEDMIGEAVYTCVRYVHNFDLSKYNNPNPFAYFTQICYHSFISYIKKQKKYSQIKDICFNNADYLMDDDDQCLNKAINYETLK